MSQDYSYSDIHFIARRIKNYHSLTNQCKRVQFSYYLESVRALVEHRGLEYAKNHFTEVFPGIQFNPAIEVFDLPPDDKPRADNQHKLF